MPKEKLKILLVGDDRPFSTGVMGLYDFLKCTHNVRVVMPQYESSGKGHAVTIDREIPIKKVSEDVFIVDGTAVDCVRIGLMHPNFKDFGADLVIAGINQGPNMGYDTYVSGTVSAAREASMRGIPSLAISKASFEPITIRDLLVVHNYFDEFLKMREDLCCSCLNINIPADGIIKGCLKTTLGARYLTKLEVSGDENSSKYSISVVPSKDEDFGQSKLVFDYRAVAHGFISVTPIVN